MLVIVYQRNYIGIYSMRIFDILVEWLFPKHTLSKTFVVYSSDNNKVDENGGPYEVMVEDVEYIDNIGNL